jgi:hypothetical protein
MSFNSDGSHIALLEKSIVDGIPAVQKNSEISQIVIAGSMLLRCFLRERANSSCFEAACEGSAGDGLYLWRWDPVEEIHFPVGGLHGDDGR